MPLERRHLARDDEIGGVGKERVRALHARAIAAHRIDIGEELVARVPHARAEGRAYALAREAPSPRIRRMPCALRHTLERARERVRVGGDVHTLEPLPGGELVARAARIDSLESRRMLLADLARREDVDHPGGLP